MSDVGNKIKLKPIQTIPVFLIVAYFGFRCLPNNYNNSFLMYLSLKIQRGGILCDI